MRACLLRTRIFLLIGFDAMESAKNHTHGRLVAVNDRGYRLGEDHQNARLTDAEVEIVRQLHERGMGYETLAEKFEVSKWLIGRICRYELRNQPAATFKKLHVSDGE